MIQYEVGDQEPTVPQAVHWGQWPPRERDETLVANGCWLLGPAPPAPRVRCLAEQRAYTTICHANR